VAIAVERREKTAGSMRLLRIPNATKAVLNSFVENAIRPEETSVFTDAWGSCKALAKLGIDHRPRKGGHGRQALDILPWAHTVFGNLETWLRGTFHGVSRLLVAERTAWAEDVLPGLGCRRRVPGGRRLRSARLDRCREGPRQQPLIPEDTLGAREADWRTSDSGH